LGIYKVQSNGKAPSGLSVGDKVVTGGGTYLITGFTGNGGYQSTLVDANMTTYNYTGGYDSLSVTKDNAGDVYNDVLTNVVNGNYDSAIGAGGQTVPGNVADYADVVKQNTMSFDDAMKLAERTLAPQYAAAMEQSAANAAQRLERAGLYDTVYGQALAAEAERDTAMELNSAIAALALQLTQSSAADAQHILEMVVNENQFGAEYDAAQKTTALKYLLELLEMQQLEAK